MKYMTPDLLARFRSDDDRVSAAASKDWDAACAAYTERLHSLHDRLPRGVRTITRRYCLHDAQVLTMAVDAKRSFSILVQLDDPEGKVIELKYQLTARGIRFFQHPPLADDGRPLQWWLYDEIDVDKAARKTPAFVHSILFTGGWELQVFFHKLKLLPLRGLLLPHSAQDVADRAEELARAFAVCS